MVYDLCEPVGVDEPNAFELMVESRMTPKDIVAMVLEKVDNAENKTKQ